MHEVFKTLVVQYKLVDVEYFMDSMQEYEIYDLYQYLGFVDATKWEQTRWLMYVTAQVNSRKKLKVEDILQFPWEEKNQLDDLPQEISKKDIKRLEGKAKEMLKYINTEQNGTTK